MAIDFLELLSLILFKINSESFKTKITFIYHSSNNDFVYIAYTILL